jgi:hypothetical protein
MHWFVIFLLLVVSCYRREEGSSATDYVTDVTDLTPKEEGRGKREEGRGKKTQNLSN